MGQYDDYVVTDYISIGAAGASLPFSDSKNGPLYGLLNALGGRRTSTNYLSAIKQSSQGWLGGDAAFSLNPLTAFSVTRPNASEAFRGLMRDIGLDQNNGLRDQMFTTAFDRAFTNPSDLQNPAHLRTALDAGFRAVLDLQSPAVLEAAINSTDPQLRQIGQLRQRELQAQEAARTAGTTIPPLTPAPLSDRERGILLTALIEKNYRDPALRPAVGPAVQDNVTRTEEYEQGLTAPNPRLNAWDPNANNGQGGMTDRFRPDF